MPSGSIEFEFKGNLAQLQRDLRSATRLAQQAARETGQATQRGFEGGLTSLFKRSPERRAERAFAGLGTALATGDVAQGLAAFTEKLSGLGLAAGIGVGVAIGIFEKFRHDIKETDAATETLRQHLNVPLKFQLGLGLEGLSSEIQQYSKEIDELEKKRESFGSKLVEFNRTQRQKTIRGRLGTELPFGPEPAGPSKEQAAINEAEERSAKIAGQRADLELNIANLKLTAAQGDLPQFD